MCKFSNSFNGNSTGSVQPQNIDGQFERAVWVWPQTLLQQETFSKWAARQTVFNMLSWVMTGGNREEINQNYIWESSEKSLVTSWRLDCNKLVWRFSYNSNIFYNKTDKCVTILQGRKNLRNIQASLRLEICSPFTKLVLSLPC